MQLCHNNSFFCECDVFSAVLLSSSLFDSIAASKGVNLQTLGMASEHRRTSKLAGFGGDVKTRHGEKTTDKDR